MSRRGQPTRSRPSEPGRGRTSRGRPTWHDARRMLYGCRTETWPLIHEWSDAEREPYQKAAEEFRGAGRSDELRVRAPEFRVCRVQRMVRYGADGPESPRPSDIDDYGPMKMHPTMDEDGTIHYES
ncbi:DUF5954 family protein [Streptomyces sp. NPDC015127]|uniref:DUF5954 family protein n=1 Tax=Streptomyces sp. NPDC015127 TaxID=3364939 RepID=UPI00370033B1